MPLPDCARIIYEKNPLETVIFQVRFPSILRIDSEIPARYQEKVRKQFPLYKENRGVEQVLPREVAKLVEADLRLRLGRPSYEFGSEDGLWLVSLARDSLALTCKQYEHWEEFKAHLEQPLAALLDEYAPAFCSRIGLRYRNVILRSALKLDAEPWSDLLKPHIAGELSSPDLTAEEVQQVATEVLIRLPSDGNQVRVVHGLSPTSGGENAYVIDSDFFTEKKTETQDVIQILDGFNVQARRLFRWCINERLHQAMGPTPARD
jgi:uncharacterized protein (TIGR04255 family)